jgi:hypothetical protein
MAYAFVKNGIVENIAENEPPPGWSLAGFTVVESATAKVGDLYDGTNFTPPQEPVPAALSRRQFIIGAMTEGFITEAEADALSATGAVPGPFAAVVAQLPAEQQVAARVTIRTATEFYRANPLVTAGMTAVGATEAQLDDFFRTYSRI